jgi:hypothetical protein
MDSLAALTVAVCILAAPPQSQLPVGPEARPAAASSEPDDDDDTREAAKRAFDLGLQAAANAEFDAAVSAFEHAYSLRPHPVTLFNLALALEKANRLPEAWELFDGMIDVVETDAERREVRRHMRTIANEIAIVEIDAKPQRRLCLDGLALPRGPTSAYRLAVEPGPRRMLLDDHEFVVDFAAGERRVLLLDDTHDLVDGRRRGPLTPALMGVTIGTGALALGFGIGAAASSHDQVRTGLAAAAATSAGLAVAAGILVLLIETRTMQDPTAQAPVPGDDCPGSPELERRLDLRLGPTIDRPVEFAQTLELPPATPGAIPIPRVAEPVEVALPRLPSLVPPRGAGLTAGP